MAVVETTSSIPGRKYKLILICAFMLLTAYFVTPLISAAGVYYGNLVTGLLGLCTIYNTSNVANKLIIEKLNRRIPEDGPDVVE